MTDTTPAPPMAFIALLVAFIGVTVALMHRTEELNATKAACEMRHDQ